LEDSLIARAVGPELYTTLYPFGHRDRLFWLSWL